jgi:predicted transcriptional regulator
VTRLVGCLRLHVVITTNGSDRQSHHTEEERYMSTKDPTRGYKTLAIRLDDDVHAQLQVIARLQDTSIAAEIAQAIDAHLQAKRSDPELSSRAASVLEDIEAESRQRQDAIASLFSDKPGATSTKATRTRGGRKAGEPEQ